MNYVIVDVESEKGPARRTYQEFKDGASEFEWHLFMVIRESDPDGNPDFPPPKINDMVDLMRTAGELGSPIGQFTCTKASQGVYWIRTVHPVDSEPKDMVGQTVTVLVTYSLLGE